MARRAALVLASNAGAGNGAAQDWPGGMGKFFAEATWGGGSAKLEQQTPNGTWVPVALPYTSTQVSLTANGSLDFYAPAGPIRAVIATATAAYVYAVGIPANVAG